jgi:hypothetical protein
MMTQALQLEMEEERRRVRKGTEDPVRSALKFVSFTMASLFVAMFVVEIGLGRPDRIDTTWRKIDDAERLMLLKERAW